MNDPYHHGDTGRPGHGSGGSSRVIIVIGLLAWTYQWKVIGCHYNSSFIDKMLTCEACGTRNKITDNYCPNCGAPMTRENTDSETE